MVAKKLGMALIIFALVCGQAAANLKMGIQVETDQDAESEIVMNAGGDMNSNAFFSAGGDLNANHVYAGNNGEGPDSVVSNNYFATGTGVKVTFNNVDWNDLPNNTLITTHTQRFDTRVETNTQAAIGAMSRALNEMARYRSGGASIGPVEYGMLEDMVLIIGLEVKDQMSPELKRLWTAVMENRDGIRANANNINVNRQDIISNRNEIIKLQNQLNKMSTSFEAMDRTLKMMDKNLYCENMMHVMNKYGFPSVKCDLNSRMCYNGDRFPFDGGRDYCLEVDEMDMPPLCYRDGTCMLVGEIIIMEGEADGKTPIMVEINNPGEDSLTAYVEIAILNGNEDEIMLSCKKELGNVDAGETERLIAYCDNEPLEPGIYTANVRVFAQGKEVYDRLGFKVHQQGLMERKIAGLDVQVSGDKSFKADVFFINVGASLDIPVVLEVVDETGRVISTHSTKAFLKTDDVFDMSFNLGMLDEGKYDIVAKAGENTAKAALYVEKEEQEGIIQNSWLLPIGYAGMVLALFGMSFKLLFPKASISFQ